MAKEHTTIVSQSYLSYMTLRYQNFCQKCNEKFEEGNDIIVRQRHSRSSNKLPAKRYHIKCWESLLH